MADYFDGKIEKDSFAPQPPPVEPYLKCVRRSSLNFVRNQKVILMIIQKGEGRRLKL
jgi:hypothetical protein